MKHRYLNFGFVLAVSTASVVTASPAAADCVQAGYSTVCSSTGEVRGGGPTPPSAAYPSPASAAPAVSVAARSSRAVAVVVADRYPLVYLPIR